MDPVLPEDAQQIVAAYTAFLESQFSADAASPWSLALLPYPKQTIKQALRTVTLALASAEQLEGELEAFLRTAYVALAEYAEPELVLLIAEYRGAMTDLEGEVGRGRDRMQGDAWRRLADAGPVVAEIARSLADEAEALGLEFDAFAVAPARAS